ncbi:protein phosphatase 2C domain-containing protein [Micromonospora taraxaci]|uniref:Protein phosphatase 2C-like protein n=1 Tax=Micromonospora taraxaci TaxID=1316803 RepID=A0A561W1T6_9ACTN|nr:protein phosphatase 2C domain-containing protein [Micromonospora taraxaci]TWG17835.1 protein phosphatase 2C-like protein [Micromonospora taraxaci]
MYVNLATSAGRPGRPNEDFVGAVPGAVVLLDGAGIPGAESLCSHGVVWYTRHLGAALLAHLSYDDGRDLAAVLASAIVETAAEHCDTCDIADPRSPQATVAVLRVNRDSLDYLLLADSFLVFDLAGGSFHVITDDREVTARRECSVPLDGLAPGNPEYDRVRASCAEALRARRNQVGGYWIAKDDPCAAQEAVTGSRPLDDLDGLALCSNGASRIVSPYALTDWPGVLELLAAEGPAGVIRRVREAEAPSGGSEFRVPDDATVAHCTFDTTCHPEDRRRGEHPDECDSTAPHGGSRSRGRGPLVRGHRAQRPGPVSP